MISIQKIHYLTKLFIKNGFRFCSSKNIFQNVYQSSHYRPRFDVQDFLKRLNIDYRDGPKTFRIRQCNFCTKPHYNDMSNMYTLNVGKESGLYYCHRCQSKGSWNQLQAAYLSLPGDLSHLLGSSQGGLPIPEDPITDAQYFIYLENLKKQDFADALQYVKSRGFTQQTIQKYKIGAGYEKFVTETGLHKDIKVIYFPMYQFESKKNSQNNSNDQLVDTRIIKVKVRGCSAENKMYSRQKPSGPKSGFFGLNTIKKSDKIVVLTEGEFDAMAVNQQTGYPAISLPQGANNLPDHLIPFLAQFQQIILWMDNDEAGLLGQSKIAYKLGTSITRIVKNTRKNLKDANDYLRQQPHEMKKLIERAKTQVQQNIMTFQDFKQGVKDRIFHAEKFAGVKIQFLPFFNTHVKGVRTKELSVVTGLTGCGKTTFLSQLSLDIAKKQIPVLWGSFQIRNQVLLTNMLIQNSGVNLYKNKGVFQYQCEQFKKLPLYFLNFHGSNDVDKVLATIQFSIQKHNVSFVVLDTLQFLLSDQAEGYKKFDLQDKVMSRLRKIATKYDTHIVIVIHPRKTEDGEDVQIHSIYGSSKASQEADNIWMLQLRPNFRIFDIKKNRFDGEIGKVAIGFNKENRSFFPLKRSELTALYNNQKTMAEVIEERTKISTSDFPNFFSIESGDLDDTQDQNNLSSKKPSQNGYQNGFNNRFNKNN